MTLDLDDLALTRQNVINDLNGGVPKPTGAEITRLIAAATRREREGMFLFSFASVAEPDWFVKRQCITCNCYDFFFLMVIFDSIECCYRYFYFVFIISNCGFLTIIHRLYNIGYINEYENHTMAYQQQ